MNVRRVAGAVCAVALISTAGVVVSQSAGAAEALDQQQSVFDGTDILTATWTQAQTFTPGRTGPLTKVQLRLKREAGTTTPLVVEIRKASEAGPGSTVLASTVVPAESVSTSGFDLESIPFATPAKVTSGSTYALVAHTNGATQQYELATGESAYPRGEAWTNENSPPSGGWASQTWDLVFATFVDGPKVAPPKPVLKAECSFTLSAKAKKKYNVIEGTNGDDRLVGTKGPDLIYGYGGHDRIRGGGGNDVICGGAGADQIYGGGGNDKISGGPGTDLVVGNKGNDVLHGNKGNDVLKGGAGTDVLRGGGGHDIVQGGPGRDDERQ